MASAWPIQGRQPLQEYFLWYTELSIKYITPLAIYLEDTLNTSLTCIVLVSEKHCSMFNANKLCIVL